MVQSQSDLVRNAIIDLIFSGHLIPGDSIDTDALRKQFNVSGTPVRDALTQLEATGLIERSQRSGAKVFVPTPSGYLALLRSMLN